jgi:hypothetical protein
MAEQQSHDCHHFKHISPCLNLRSSLMSPHSEIRCVRVDALRKQRVYDGTVNQYQLLVQVCIELEILRMLLETLYCFLIVASLESVLSCHIEVC